MGSAVADVLIAVTMTYIVRSEMTLFFMPYKLTFLQKLLSKKNTAIPSTSAVISRIVRLVVETGALTGEFR